LDDYRGVIATSRVLSVVLALSGAGALALAAAGCGHSRAGTVVSASGRVGKLRIDRSTAADVRRLAGAPAFRGKGAPAMSGGSIVPSYQALGYACSRRSQYIRCGTVYFVDARTGRLAGFWTDSPGFRTDRGSRPGMREDVADRLEGAHSHVEALTGIYRATRVASLFVENAGCKPGPNLNASPCLGGRVRSLILEGRRDPVGLLEDAFPVDGYPGLPVAASAQPSGAQALRTCADRWNQGNMVSWGPTFAGVAFRRPNAYERTYLGVPDRPQCFVVLAVSYKRSHPQEPCADHPFPGLPQFCFRPSQTYSCVMERSGAYVCPTNAEGSPPLRKQNGTVAGYGVLTLRISLAGTHATRPLAWQRRYPRVDGFVEPWTSGGILRPGLRFKGEGSGRCFLVAETIRSAISCLTRTGARYNACFPQQRDWGAGDLAACGAPGGTTFVRWRITRRF
jgi:hypothetical protein